MSAKPTKAQRAVLQVLADGGRFAGGFIWKTTEVGSPQRVMEVDHAVWRVLVRHDWLESGRITAEGRAALASGSAAADGQGRES